MDCTNLENNLRQRLTLITGTLTHLSSQKSELKLSAKEAKRNISIAINHLISCIKTREKELLLKVQDIVYEKENFLCELEEQLNKDIGAFQQSLEYTSHSKFKENFYKLNKKNFDNIYAAENFTKSSIEILFEHDSSNLRKDIALFGNVFTEPYIINAINNSTFNVENCKNDTNLLHKSNSSASKILFSKDQMSETNLMINKLQSVKQIDSNNENDCVSCQKSKQCLSDTSFDILSEVNKTEIAASDISYKTDISTIEEINKNNIVATKTIKEQEEKLSKQMKKNFSLNPKTSTINTISYLQDTFKSIKRSDNSNWQINYNKSLLENDTVNKNYGFYEVIDKIKQSNYHNWILF